MKTVAYLLLLFSPVLSFVLTQNNVKVDAKVGAIIGKIEDVTVGGLTREIAVFLGIPYAEAPVGALRFAKPVQRAKLPSPYNATEFKAGCLQIKNMIPGLVPELSEDCLFLNIFFPGVSAGNKKYPVMVWIYGGGFKAGYSNGYNAASLSAYGDVIVVTLNYRVGVFGFLSTEDGSATGNYGLWDQHMAIKWVHDNIDEFGGDPNRVTIFGESSGSASTVYQALYKGNDGLFQRVISESGSVNSPREFTPNPVVYAEIVAKAVGCDQNTTDEYIECMKNKTADDLDRVINTPQTGIGFMPWTPVQDNDFVTYNPNQIFTKSMASSKERNFLGSLDFLTGVNSLEGALLVTFFAIELNLTNPEDIAINRDEFENIFIPSALSTVFGSKIPQAAIDAAVFEYTDWEDPNNNNIHRETVVRMASDYTFYSPAVQTINAKTETNSTTGTYFYKFSTRPSTHFLPVPSWIDGVGKANHEDDVPFVFGFDKEMLRYNFVNGYNVSKEEMEVSKLMMTMWTNFAKSG